MGVIISAISGGEVLAAGLDTDDVMEIEVDGVSRWVKIGSLIAAWQLIDPITGADLDPLTVHEPFVVQDASDNPIWQVLQDTGITYVQIRAVDGATVEFASNYAGNTGLLTFQNPAGSDQLQVDTNGVRASDAAGERFELDTVSGSLELRDTTAVQRALLTSDGSGLTLYDDAGDPIQRIGDEDVAFFAASPYGQDAFEDPSTITPETLANYQIARGFMAAA